MKTVVDQFMDLLQTAGVGTRGASSGWRIVGYRTPDGQGVPHSCITVAQTGELPPNPKWMLDFPSIQVQIRGNPNDVAGAAQKAEDVRNAMLGLPSQTINDVRWVSVRVLSSGHIGFDQETRPIFAVNFSLILEPATSVNRSPI